MGKDELRDEIVEVTCWIKELADAIPIVYDANKTIAEKFPNTHKDFHITQLKSDFDGISFMSDQILKTVREYEEKLKTAAGTEEIETIST